jgi:uncharacterized protein with ATP-grasp and redox domains
MVRVDDPFAEDKKRYNAFALSLLPEMRRTAAAAHDPFLAGIKFAIAANIIDFGKIGGLSEKEVVDCLNSALDTPVDESAARRIREKIVRADKIL